MIAHFIRALIFANLYGDTDWSRRYGEREM